MASEVPSPARRPRRPPDRECPVVAYELRFGTDLDGRAVESFLAALAAEVAPPARVALETIARPGGLTHRLRVATHRADAVLAQLRAAIATLRWERVDDPPSLPDHAVEFALFGSEGFLRREHPAAISAALLAALQPLRHDETIVVQWVLSGVGSRVGATWSQLIDRHVRTLAGVPVSYVDPKVAADKAQQPLLIAGLRVAATAADPARARALVARATAPLGMVATRATYLRGRPVPTRTFATRAAQAAAPARGSTFRVTAAELAGLIGWPLDAPQLPGVALGVSRHFHTQGLAEHGIVLGRTAMPGVEQLVALEPDMLLQHLALTSPTGTGKSTFLGNVLLQAIARHYGTVLFDWKGDLVRTVRDRLHRDDADRVIILDPTDPDVVVGIPNPFAVRGPHRDRILDQQVGILDRLWESSVGPRTGALIQASVFTLGHADGTTLIDIAELLTNERFRHEIVSRLDDDTGLARYWATFDALSVAQRAQVIAPTLNRARAWLLRADLRHLFGQVTPTWTFDEVLDGKILLVNLASGELGDEAATLAGAMLLNLLLAAIKRRSRRPPQDRPTALVVLDEFQHVTALPVDFADALAEARGLGVGFALGHQLMHQLDVPLREAVRANARTRVAFQVNATDANLLAKDLGVAPGDLQHLPAFEAIARIATTTGISGPVTFTTVPLPNPTGHGPQITQRSRARYARSRRQIDEGIRARYQPKRAAPAEIGVRRRPDPNPTPRTPDDHTDPRPDGDG